MAVPAQRLQGAGFGQGSEGMTAQAGAVGEVFDRVESGAGAGLQQLAGLHFGQAAGHAQAQAQFRLTVLAALQGAIPLADRDIDRAEAHAVAARIVDQLCRSIETQGLGVEQGSAEGGGLVVFEPAGDVSQQSEGSGMALREAVSAEAQYLFVNPVGEFIRVIALLHALLEFDLEFLQASAALPGRHGASHLVGLAGREAGGDDGDIHYLFLEQRHAQRALQHIFQRSAFIFDLFLLVPSLQVGMNHVALNRPRPHDGDFDHQVKEIHWFESRQHAHLRPRFDLEYADGFGLADHVISRRVLGWNRGDGQDRLITVFRHQLESSPQGAEHAQRQHVDLEQAHRIQIVLVPLDDGAVRHGGLFHRHQGVQGMMRNDEAADMLRQVARHAFDLADQAHEIDEQCAVEGEAHRGETLPQLFRLIPPGMGLGQGIELVQRQAQRLAYIAHGAAAAISDHGSGDGGPLAAIFFVDVLDHFFAALVLEVDIDVRRLGTLFRDEALEQEVDAIRIDLGDAQGVAHHRVRG